MEYDPNCPPGHKPEYGSFGVRYVLKNQIDTMIDLLTRIADELEQLNKIARAIHEEL